MMLTPRWRRPSDFRMSKPTLISSTGSAASDTRMVSPMPAQSSEPMPMADLIVPVRRRAGLGDAQVQRAVDGLGQLLVGGHGHEQVGGLNADLELVEVVILQDARVVQRALDHGLGAWLAVFFQQVLFQRAGVDADAHGAAVVAGGLDHLAHPLAADVAGVDAQAGRAGLGRLDSALVVEVDVGHERDLGRLGDGLEGRGGVLVGAGHAHDVRAGLLQLANLGDGRLRVRRQGVGHGLHGDGRIAAHLHRTHPDLAAGASLDHPPGANMCVILHASTVLVVNCRPYRRSQRRCRRGPRARKDLTRNPQTETFVCCVSGLSGRFRQPKPGRSPALELFRLCE